MLAAVRPGEWNGPLLLHVAGAMLLVGALALAAGALVAAFRADQPDDTASLTRLSLRALLIGALPAFLLMRVGAELLAAEENVGEPAWINIGYGVSDFGLLLVLAATVTAGLTRRRLGRGGAASALGRVAAGLCVLVVVAYVVAIWAMTTKPA